MLKKGIFVGGTFHSDDNNDNGYSKIFDIIYKSALEHIEGIDIDYFNGGKFSELTKILDNINEYDLIVWMANVNNTEEKIV